MVRLVKLWNAIGRRGRSMSLELGVVAAMLVLLTFMIITRINATPGTVSVTATMTAFSSSVVKVGSSVTSTLTGIPGSNYNPPVPSADEAALTKTYGWSVQVLYKGTWIDPQTGKAGAYGTPPLDSYTETMTPQTQPTTQTSSILTFTPKIVGYWEVSVTCTLNVVDTKNSTDTWSGSANAGPKDFTSYALDINYGGNVVTKQTQNVSVGEQIPVTAVYGPSDMTLQWNVPATIVANYQADATTATVTPVISTDLTKPNLTYYWVYTDNGQTTNEKVTLTGVLPNPQTAAEVVMTTFNVYEPSATMKGTDEGATTADDNYIWDVNHSSTDVWLHFGGSYNPAGDASGIYTPGIEFTASWTTPPTQYGTNFTCVQVINAMDIYWVTQNVQYETKIQTGANYVDTTYPYGWEHFSRLSGGSTSDSPGMDLTSDSLATYSLDAEMYLMFQPTGTNTIPVPVSEVDWSWAGSWPPASGNTSQPTTLVPSQEPQWNANIKSVMPTNIIP